MHAANFDLSRYFHRIGHTGDARADAATLAALVRRQLFSVPFENLDIQAGRGVSLAPEDIVRKIVDQGRGGYCYEVNGLFSMALTALGIPHRYIAARPMFYPARRPRTHMALIASASGQDWLCDLGFGSHGLRAPLPMDPLGVPVPQDDDTFRLSRPDGGDFLLQARLDGQWVNQYGFDLSPQEWVDFEPANHLNATHPGAIFVQKRVLVRHHPTGRDILLGDQLKTFHHGVVHTRAVPPEELPGVLKERFGLAVPA